jgi:hypothetical protein
MFEEQEAGIGDFSPAKSFAEINTKHFLKTNMDEYLGKQDKCIDC